MIRVIFVDMLGHFSRIEYFADYSVNFLKLGLGALVDRKFLKNLEDFDLEPWTRCHIIKILLSVLVHRFQNMD